MTARQFTRPLARFEVVHPTNVYTVTRNGRESEASPPGWMCAGNWIDLAGLEEVRHRNWFGTVRLN